MESCYNMVQYDNDIAYYKVMIMLQHRCDFETEKDIPGVNNVRNVTKITILEINCDELLFILTKH